MAISLERKYQLLFIVVMMSLLLLFLSPFILWQIKKTQPLDVLIMNKTVINEEYNGHQGLIWLLNHEKYRKTNSSEAYSANKDYVGFNPLNQQEIPLPEDLSSYDILYLADTYGVYEDWNDHPLQHPSQLIYGGLEMEELNRIEQSLYQEHQTLIVEFNSFGTPTKPEVSEKLQQLLNIKSTGWIGKFFSDLSEEQVPRWIQEMYEKKYQEKFPFQEAGLIFIHQEGNIFLFPRTLNKEDFVYLEWNERAERLFGVKGKQQYHGWFDLIEANHQKDVLSTYEILWSEEEQAMIEAEGLPKQMIGATFYQHASYNSFYLTGNFGSESPQFYQGYGIKQWKQLARVKNRLQEDQLFWLGYVPLMQSILANGKTQPSSPVIERPIVQTDQSRYFSRAKGKQIERWTGKEWEKITIKGVNMGMANPGHFPGEAAITKAEYQRWFEQIQSMHANVIRIYTIHPPAFYEALAEHNADRDQPLYVYHGVWLNEETMVEKQNVYDEAVVLNFEEEMKKTVDLIHGQLDIPYQPGHAHGMYRTDVSDYILGWIVGTEWDPEVALQTNEQHPEMKFYEGQYIEVKQGSPIEIWMAERMDLLIAYEQEKYQIQRPMSFTNWVTTDLIDHPMEPLEKEDLVSIDPNVMKATNQFLAGLFASYHIYPYYPDFLNLDPKYTEYVDHRGEKNNYAGYLNDLIQRHEMPVIVAEFGVPSSRGITHLNVDGKNQGGHSEQQQGKIVQHLYEDILAEGYAGGLVFTWQDEWFKRTWNTMDLDHPDRRPFWFNAQTNEQQFGLLAFEPNEANRIIRLDGKEEDWKRNTIKPVIDEQSKMKHWITHDEKSLIIRLDWSDVVKGQLTERILIPIQTRNKKGQQQYPDLPGEQFESLSYLVEINPQGKSRLWIDSYYDFFTYQYGGLLEMIPYDPAISIPNNGKWSPIHYALNKAVKTDWIELPFESYETGILKQGTDDPASPHFDSLSDFWLDKENKVLELKLPWLLLQFKDPSQKEIIGDIWEKGPESSEHIDSIGLSFYLLGEENVVAKSFDKKMFRYSWENWDSPRSHERLKKSYFILQEAFSRVND